MNSRNGTLGLTLFAASVRVAADGGANRLLSAEKKAKDYPLPEALASLNNITVSMSSERCDASFCHCGLVNMIIGKLGCRERGW